MNAICPMLRLPLPVTLLFLLAALTTPPVVAQTGEAVPEMSALDANIEAFMEKWDVPGGAVAVSYQGRLVYARGFGLADTDAEEPVEPTSTFRIASVSKSITGIAAAKLIDEGTLSLNAKVFGTGGILTDTPYSTLHDPRMEDITVSHLLHHVSGIGNLSPSNRDPVFADHEAEAAMGFGLPHSPADKIEYYLKTQTLKRNPGSGYEYSNLGYLILGRVIEAVTGLSYAEYCRTALFEPLGIKTIRMGHSLPGNRLPREVKYYEPASNSKTTSVYGTGEQVPWSYGGFNVETFEAHGGWTASVIDLVRLLDAVDGFATSPDILPASAIQTLTTTLPTSAGYALGFSVNAAPHWWHMGSIDGTTAEWVRAAGGYNFALLFNYRAPGAQLNQFNGEADGLFWGALGSFTGWPSHDLYDQYTSIEATTPGLRETELVLSVFPNPADTEIRVQVVDGGYQPMSIAIYDLLGRRLRVVGPVAGLTADVRVVNVQNLPPGRYFVRATTDGKVATRMVEVVR